VLALETQPPDWPEQSAGRLEQRHQAAFQRVVSELALEQALEQALALSQVRELWLAKVAESVP
jgi:hypothetical protein